MVLVVELPFVTSGVVDDGDVDEGAVCDDDPQEVSGMAIAIAAAVNILCTDERYRAGRLPGKRH